MDNQQERFEKRIAWLTAMIEGEGWISLGKALSHQSNKTKTVYYKPQIGCVNSDKLIMNEILFLFESLGLKYRYQIRKSGLGSDGVLRKERYEISISSVSDIMILSKAILPYMIGEKKNRLHKVLEFIRIRKEKGKGKNGKYGEEEEQLYKELYSFKGRSRSKILNDYTPSAALVMQ
jgi:hypothetical protein